MRDATFATETATVGPVSLQLEPGERLTLQCATAEEAAIVADERNLHSIHHYARSTFGFPDYLDHVSVLDKRIDVERDVNLLF